MKSIRPLALLALAGVAVAATTQDITLTRTSKEGSTDSYLVTTKTKQDMDIPQMGQQDMTLDSTMKMAYKYGKSAAGKQDVDIVMSDIKIVAGGTLGAMIGDQMGSMIPKEFKMAGKMDARGSFSDIKVDKMDTMTAMMMNAQQMANSMTMVVFPEKPIKIGDTWTMPIPDNKTVGIKGATLNAKLNGEKTVDEIACYEIAVDGVIPMKVNLGELGDNAAGGGGGLPADTTMSGKMTTKGTVLVEKTTGRLINYKGTLKSDTTMDLGGQGSAKITGDTSIDVKLQK